MWKLNKSIAKESLPTQPVDITIEPWWEFVLPTSHWKSLTNFQKKKVQQLTKYAKRKQMHSCYLTRLSSRVFTVGDLFTLMSVFMLRIDLKYPG